MSNELTPMQAMRSTLTNMRNEFQAALPPQIPVEKFIRTTLTAVQMNPELLQADRRSLLGTCMKAAQDGLLLDGREAAPVIFRGKDGAKVQYMPMVGGILKKIRNSGELASISANVAYDKDLFQYELGDNESITHKPFLGSSRGVQLAVYAIAKTKDGAIYREVMSVAEVEKVRGASKTGKFGPWVDWWDEMAKKTVIRRLSKRLPSSADVDSILADDLKASGFDQIERQAPVNITPAPEDQVEPLSRLKASMSQTIDPVIDAETGEFIQQEENHVATDTQGTV
jgi:recombination protein RecT